MECLYKLVSEDYLVDIFNDNNSIDIHVPKKRRKRQFRWTHSATLEKTEEEFWKH